MSTTTMPKMIREGGEVAFTELFESDHPYLQYLGNLSSGIANKVEQMGVVRTDMDDVFEQAFSETVTSMPQISEIGPVEIGVPKDAGELKAWTLGCVTQTLVHGWALGEEFNVWAQANLAGDLPIYQPVAA